MSANGSRPSAFGPSVDLFNQRGVETAMALTNSLLVSLTNGWGNVTITTNQTYSAANGTWVFRLVSRICGLILAPEADRACDRGLFP